MGGDPRRAMIWKGLFEVVLISVGVFLAMAADQWRTDRQHREQAHQALQRLKTEIENNRAAILGVKEYHALLQKHLGDYLDPKLRAATTLKITRGMSPVNFEHTAWDLALATQALADIDSTLAFEIARVYGAQQIYTGLTSGVTQAMYLRPPTQDMDGFLHTVKVWLDDIVGFEPSLLAAYGHVLPMIDAALKD